MSIKSIAVTVVAFIFIAASSAEDLLLTENIGESYDATNTFYVIPNNNATCPSTHECHTLDYYISYNKYFRSNTSFKFMPGDHFTNRTLEAENITGLSLKGIAHGRDFPTIWCKFVFRAVSQLFLDFLTFNSRVVPNGSLYPTVYIDSCFDVSLCNISILNSSALQIGNTYGHIIIKNLHVISSMVFKSNRSTSSVGGSYVHFDNCEQNTKQQSNISINGSVFKFLNKVRFYAMTIPPKFHLTSGLKIYRTCGNVNIDIIRSVFIGFTNIGYSNGTNGGNMALVLVHSPQYLLNVNMRNCLNQEGRARHGGGLYINLSADQFGANKTDINNNIVSLDGLSFFNNLAIFGGGAIYLREYTLLHDRQFHVRIRNCTFKKNSLKTYGNGGIALHIVNLISLMYLFQPSPIVNITVANTTFTENSMHDNHLCSSGNGVVFASRASLLKLTDSRIVSNKCTAISAVGSKFMLQGNINISWNRAPSGGGFMLCEGSYFILSAYTNVTIAHNHAEHVGGGICVEGECSKSIPLCFYQFDRPTAQNTSLQKTTAVNLINNTAQFAGENLFGGSVENCDMVETKSSHRFNDIFRVLPDPASNTSVSSVTSSPVAVCFCTEDNLQKDCSITSKAISVFPGESFLVPAIVVGQLNGGVPGIVRASTNNVTQRRFFYNSQVIQRITKAKCDTLRYTALSMEKSESFSLNAQHEGDSSGYKRHYDRKNIDIHLKYCPLGFNLTRYIGTSDFSCRCLTCLKNSIVIKCNITSRTITSSASAWIGYLPNPSDTNSNKKYLIQHKHCPFDYCISKEVKLKSTNNSLSQDEQCRYNRTGIVCGKCPSNLSVILGSSQCWDCSSTSLSLLVAFAVAGIALVLLLTILNLTISEGTLSGLIFYSNAIQIHITAFFPYESKSTYIQFLKVFLAWINLDFGISACFYNGMDTYAKAWLQFAFPLYIWALSGLIVYLCSRYLVFTKLAGKNSVKVLATLILVSYTKMLRSIMTTLTFIPQGFHELKEPDSESPFWEVSQHREVLLWLSDPNVVYMQGKHIPLFVVGVTFCIICIPFTFILLCVQHVYRIPGRKGLFWISRLKPFFDAYTGQNSKQGRFWTGLLLLIRILLCLLSAIYLSTEQSTYICITITFCSILLLISQSLKQGVYSSHKLNMFESFHLINLICLCAWTAHNRMTHKGLVWQERATGFSVSIAFLSFVFIVLLQIWKKIASVYCIVRIRRWLLNSTPNVLRLQQLVKNNSDDDDGPVVNFPPVCHFNEDREPLLAST